MVGIFERRQGLSPGKLAAKKVVRKRRNHVQEREKKTIFDLLSVLEILRGPMANESEKKSGESDANVAWAANKRFGVSKLKFKFPRARTFELYRARSRLYRSQILQVNTRWN